MNFDIASLPLPVRLIPSSPMGDEELMRFSRANRPLRMEREGNGDILIMTPTGNLTGIMNRKLIRLLDEWAESDGRGITFDSDTGFNLRNGAVRSPDASWLSNEKWNALTPDEQEGYGTCPEFIVELTSPSDRLPAVRRKIEQEWMHSGVQVAWLIDPKSRSVTIYRQGEEPEVLTDPSSVQGNGPVSGFELVMSQIWGAA